MTAYRYVKEAFHIVLNTAVSAQFRDLDLATLWQAVPTVAPCDLSATYDQIPATVPAARPSVYVMPTADRALPQDAMTKQC